MIVVFVGWSVGALTGRVRPFGVVVGGGGGGALLVAFALPIAGQGLEIFNTLLCMYIA